MSPVPNPIKMRIRILLRRIIRATASQKPEVNTLNILDFKEGKGIENQ